MCGIDCNLCAWYMNEKGKRNTSTEHSFYLWKMIGFFVWSYEISFWFQSLLVHNTVFVISVIIGYILSTVLGNLVLLPLLTKVLERTSWKFLPVRTCLHTHTYTHTHTQGRSWEENFHLQRRVVFCLLGLNCSHGAAGHCYPELSSWPSQWGEKYSHHYKSFTLHSLSL